MSAQSWQVLHAEAWLQRANLTASNVVFMGMGEPLLTLASKNFMSPRGRRGGHLRENTTQCFWLRSFRTCASAKSTCLTWETEKTHMLNSDQSPTWDE